MADARSLLRQSREARKINHPHASYTSGGKLLCNLCETIIKSEAAWQGHLHSSQHTLRQTRAQEAATAREANGGGKKRKASTQDSPTHDERKKAKPTVFAPGVADDEEESGSQEAPAKLEKPAQNGNGAPPSAEDEGADAAELEAFERELAEMERSMPSNTANQAEITITAAPMTAEEIAAQAREEQSAQRGRRDEELEAEKDEAARIMEEEFEEMEGLEERVKKLREKREALRKATGNGPAEDAATDVVAQDATQPNGQADEDSDDEDEEYDDWNFGGR